MASKKEKKLAERNQGILNEVISELKKKFGEGAIMKLSETRAVEVDVIPTGATSLDLALGVGGVPRGRMIEIFGPESSGKTTLALHILAQAQKSGGKGAFIDAEHALDPDYARRIGVKIEDLLISQPDSGEQALYIVEALVRSGEVDVIVVDSVAALVPRAEVAAEMGEFQIGLQARLLSQALRKLASLISKTKTVLIFLNQIRMKVGVMFGNPETTPGGLALKFYSSVRIDLRRKAQIKSGEEIIGSRVLAKIVKNKVAPPFKTAEFDIYYNQGISYWQDLLNIGQKQGLIKKVGSFFQYHNFKLGQGFEKARDFLKEHPEISSKIREELLSTIKTN
jgi:recombination protein RecA